MNQDNQRPYDFPPVTGQEWLEKVRADLRGRLLEDTAWEYAPGLTTSPFAHSDDLGDFVSTVPFAARWEMCEVFEVSDPVASHSAILEALAGGCESIILRLNSLPDWERLLHGVHPGLIHTLLEPDEGLDPEMLYRDFDQFISLQDYDPVANWALRVRTRGTPNSIFGIQVHGVDDPITGLADALLSAVDQDPQRVQFICRVSTAYFVEIARLRALQILFLNLQLAQGKRTPVPASIEAHCRVTTDRDSPHDGMIQYGIAALAAICGGAGRLVVALPPGVEPTASQLRTARNVHHLLRYESKVENLQDPVQGAYFIERLTREIVRRTWDLMIEQSEKGGR